MIDGAIFLAHSPFARLRTLIGATPPGASIIDMTIGEPQHGAPAFALEILRQNAGGFSKYPPVNGIPALRESITGWLGRRYALNDGVVDPERHVLPLNGTREGLVSAAVIAAAHKQLATPAILMPNPFYQAYYAAALAAGCEPFPLRAGRAEGYMPDLDALSPELLDRTAAFYVASPANPQGVIAPLEYLQRVISLARRHNFFVFFDECYSEIYNGTPPTGALQAAAATGTFEKVLAFNSLSKRSSAPGLRSGFIAGDPAFIKDFLAYRNVAAPQVPLPIQHASAALWGDEEHVDKSRALYLRKMESARQHLNFLPGFALPEGGFFLWLDLTGQNGGERAALTIWQRCGVKLLPGAYLAQSDAHGENPGVDYGRAALVGTLDVTEEALSRLSAALAS